MKNKLLIAAIMSIGISISLWASEDEGRKTVFGNPLLVAFEISKHNNNFSQKKTLMITFCGADLSLWSRFKNDDGTHYKIFDKLTLLTILPEYTD